MADDPRDALLAVARDIIDKRGYLGLSVRTASAAAGVTPEVARRYYRNRDQLFAAALRLPVDPTSAIPTLVAPGLEGMGERLVRFTLDLLKDPQARSEIVSLARTGVNAGHAVMGLQDFLERGVVDRVAAAIGVPDARMRSALISSYLLGIAMIRYGVRLEPLASASEEEVIRMVAPVIQDLLDPRKPIPGSSRARTRPAPGPTGVVHAPTGAPVRTFDPDPKGRAAAARDAAVARAAARKAAQPGSGRPARPASASAPARRAPTRAAGTSTGSRGSAPAARTTPDPSAAGAPEPAGRPAPTTRRAGADEAPTDAPAHSAANASGRPDTPPEALDLSAGTDAPQPADASPEETPQREPGDDSRDDSSTAFEE